MPLGLVDFFEVGIVGDILDTLLQRDDLVVARHDGDGTELKPLKWTPDLGPLVKVWSVLLCRNRWSDQ